MITKYAQNNPRLQKSSESEAKIVYYLLYLLLNYIPAVLWIIISMIFIEMNVSVFAVTYLFVQPLYLLFVNISFIRKKTISYIAGIIYMISVVLFNLLHSMAVHRICILKRVVYKIQTDCFLGDAPIELYYYMFVIPTSIIIVGIGILYLVRKARKTQRQ